MNINKEQIERMAQIAKVLGHPTRILILQFLAGEKSCYFGDISEIVPVSKATISQHLAALKNAGLIIGEILPPKSCYCINPKAWVEVKELFGSLIDTCMALPIHRCNCDDSN